MAFRGNGPQQHLYTVSFATRDIWREGYEGPSQGKGDNEDRVTLDIYEGWLRSPSEETSDSSGQDVFSSNRGEGVIGSGDKSVFKDDSSAHDHTHDNDSKIISESSDTDGVGNSHDHDHDHVHESRVVVECRAVENEDPESPGQRIGTILIRLLISKGVLTADDIHKTVEKLETFSDKLLGADLVVKAWMDPDFKARLLSDGLFKFTLLFKLQCVFL